MWRWVWGAVLAAALGGAACAADRPEGLWVSQSGNVVVQIGPCGPVLCGRVIRVMGNNAMTGPGPSASAPARVGLLVMSGFTPSGDGRWTGKIYNREDGRTYDCVITPSGHTMQVRAYVLFPVFGKSQTWTRAG